MTAVGVLGPGERLTGVGSAVLGAVLGLVLVLPFVLLEGRGAAELPKGAASGEVSHKLSVVESFQGEATWYGPGMEGGVTASGAPFDQGAFAAAHPTLPFGTIVRVSRLDGPQEVQVVVNDRLPDASATRIDLTRAAGQAIGMIDDGRAPVLLEVLEPRGDRAD